MAEGSGGRMPRSASPNPGSATCSVRTGSGAAQGVMVAPYLVPQVMACAGMAPVCHPSSGFWRSFRRLLCMGCSARHVCCPSVRSPLRVTATVVGPLTRRRSRALRLAAPLHREAGVPGGPSRPSGPSRAPGHRGPVGHHGGAPHGRRPTDRAGPSRLVLNTEATVEVHIPDAVDDLQAYVLLDSVGTDRVVRPADRGRRVGGLVRDR